MLPVELPFLEHPEALALLVFGFVLVIVVFGAIGLTLEFLGRLVTRLLGPDD